MANIVRYNPFSEAVSLREAMTVSLKIVLSLPA